MIVGERRTREYDIYFASDFHRMAVFQNGLLLLFRHDKAPSHKSKLTQPIVMRFIYTRRASDSDAVDLYATGEAKVVNIWR